MLAFNKSVIVISYQNPGSNAFSRLKMPTNNLIADNFLIQFSAHAILKYRLARPRKKALSLFTKVTCAKNGGKKIEVRLGERLHLQWHKDTFSQAHDSADSKLKVNLFYLKVSLHFSLFLMFANLPRPHNPVEMLFVWI